MEQGRSVPTHKAWRKAFHGRWETNWFWKTYWGTVLHDRLMIRPWQEQGSFTNAFSSYLKTVNLKTCHSWRDIHLKINILSPDQSTELWKYLFLKLIVKSFQRLCHVQLDLGILFVKLTAQIGYCIWKILSAHYVSGVGEFIQYVLFLFEIFCKVLRLQSYFRFA